MNIIEWRNYLLESDTSATTKFVGLILTQYYRPNKPTYPAKMTLAALASIKSHNTIDRAIEELKALGFISYEKKRLKGNKFDNNVYRFIGVIDTSNIDTSNIDTSNIDTSVDTSVDTSNIDYKEEEVEEREKKNIKKENKPENVSEQTWNDFKILRASKKAPITKTAIGKIITQAMLANYTLEEALQECCERGWQSFKAEWVQKGKYGKPAKQSLHKDERETLHIGVV